MCQQERPSGEGDLTVSRGDGLRAGARSVNWQVAAGPVHRQPGALSQERGPGSRTGAGAGRLASLMHRSSAPLVVKQGEHTFRRCSEEGAQQVNDSSAHSQSHFLECGLSRVRELGPVPFFMKQL